MAGPGFDGQLAGIMNQEVIEAIAPPPELRTAYDQLRPFERQFVDIYLTNDNPLATVKAIFPGHELTAAKAKEMHRVRAFDLIRRPLVQAAIAEKLKRHGEKWDLTVDRVLAELAKIAYANIDDYLTRNPDGTVSLDLSEGRVTRDQMAAIGEVKVEEYTDKEGGKTVKTTFKMHDKLNALEKAMKHLGLFAPEKHQFTGVIAAVGAANNGGEARQIVTIDMNDEQAGQAYANYLLGGS